jgi:putative ABC transport system ATP-binding protein
MINLTNVTKTFSLGSVEIKALRGVSLNIPEGQMMAIQGPSGSGKSTLMNLLGCLDVPSSGSYFLEGQDVGNLSDNKLAEIRSKKIGFIFQTYNLLPRSTALSNVEMPMIYGAFPNRKKTAIQSLIKVGLEDRLTHKPSELSGGQQQRVGIARALAKNPSIILADEPTGNLDSQSSQDIMKILQELNQNEKITIVVITHEDYVAKSTSRIVKIFDGLIVDDQTN